MELAMGVGGVVLQLLSLTSTSLVEEEHQPFYFLSPPPRLPLRFSLPSSSAPAFPPAGPRSVSARVL
eukprot:3066043-Rhodomonas_salina.1